MLGSANYKAECGGSQMIASLIIKTGNYLQLVVIFFFIRMSAGQYLSKLEHYVHTDKLVATSRSVLVSIVTDFYIFRRGNVSLLVETRNDSELLATKTCDDIRERIIFVNFSTRFNRNGSYVLLL